MIWNNNHKIKEQKKVLVQRPIYGKVTVYQLLVWAPRANRKVSEDEYCSSGASESPGPQRTRSRYLGLWAPCSDPFLPPCASKVLFFVKWHPPPPHPLCKQESKESLLSVERLRTKGNKFKAKSFGAGRNCINLFIWTVTLESMRKFKNNLWFTDEEEQDLAEWGPWSHIDLWIVFVKSDLSIRYFVSKWPF